MDKLKQVKAPQDMKYYYDFVIAVVLFGLVCIPTAGKTIDILGIPLSISIFYFPLMYVISDILTEVYGYALARRAIWYSCISQAVAVIIFQAVALAPPSVTMQNNDAFFSVLSQAPLIVTVGIVATFVGDITNNFVVAKMKIADSGKNMAKRFVVSTFSGQLVNTFVFYFFALTLTGIIPLNAAVSSIILATLSKTLVEIVFLPLTIRIVTKVKEVENLDIYDNNTDFNPLKF